MIAILEQKKIQDCVSVCDGRGERSDGSCSSKISCLFWNVWLHHSLPAVLPLRVA